MPNTKRTRLLRRLVLCLAANVGLLLLLVALIWRFITDFTHCELQFFAQSLWFINGVRAALVLVVTISQFDIAVAKVVYTELTGLLMVFLLLSGKRFALDDGEERAELLGSVQDEEV
jgi:hypothetical protein